ncbi:TolC family outer membrane protein [Sphingobium mellinum]|uniref:TolC family outer membrane protein n=1 Tax=Sphingobium mellinum TaxID=1387166 RepID=UPI0030EB85B4
MATALSVTSICASAQTEPQARTVDGAPSANYGQIPTPSVYGSKPAIDIATPVQTLHEAVKRAYWTNPTLLAQRAQLRALDYRLPQARAGYGPKLDISGSYGYERDNFELSTGGYIAAADWTATAAAVVTQPLYTFGRIAADERGANANISFGRNALRATEMKVLLNAIVAYASFIRDNDGVIIARDNLALLARESADTATRLHAGEATSTDHQQVETRVSLGRAQLYAAQEQLESSRAEFLRATGGLPGDLAAPQSLSLPVASLEEAYAFAQRSDPILAAAYSREKVSRAALQAARAEQMPRVDLRGRAESGTIQPYSSALRQTSLRGEVVVSAPIFDSGLRRARIAEAREANDSDWRLIDAALRDSRVEVASAWNMMVAQRASVVELMASADSAQRAYDGALQQERAGLRTTLDVLDLARELLTARTALNNSRTEAYLAEARLLAAMGALDGHYLLPDETLYDPDTHYARSRNDGDVPLLTPMIRALDGIGSRSELANRTIRDPTGPITTPGLVVDQAAVTAIPPPSRETPRN